MKLPIKVLQLPGSQAREFTTAENSVSGSSLSQLLVKLKEKSQQNLHERLQLQNMQQEVNNLLTFEKVK